jgi:hypothetical protein
VIIHTPAREAVVKAHLNRIVSGRGHLLRSGVAVRGIGYIPDKLATRAAQRDSREVFDSSTATGDEASLAASRAATLDQGQNGACTGAGTSMILYVSSGAKLPFFPSPRVNYGVVRILELPSATAPLTDSGAMPSDLIAVVNQWGIVPMGFGAKCPTPDGRNFDLWSDADTGGSSPANVNDKPDLLALETAGETLEVVPLRVDETSADFGAQLKASINAKTAAGIGIFVDTAFQNWDPSTGPIRSIDLNDPQGGGHWLELDYFYTLSGELVLGGVNSWSDMWPQSSGRSPSPFWKPGGWEMTLTCLKTTCSDCLLFPVSAPVVA